MKNALALSAFAIGFAVGMTLLPLIPLAIFQKSNYRRRPPEIWRWEKTPGGRPTGRVIEP